ncbi:MAG: aldo/keto reductase [Candidatus Neomarinimicrobiota bacterium]|jgi:aryl-alcohol dehydrogenase-like predicted oxidoreductase|nr:aldo/keto reductase [Candidatus Neomarinimicrobiota bacterium]MDD3966297.1 aldo/keto reductase [Candidatus Neomarinimicrobiota bacterium]MDX9779661.1 aldo/keto reductase [bacterium]
MQYTQLGKRGPRISTVGFGAWAIGGMNWGKTDDEVSKTALRKAIENGVTFIDTADVYGFGHSEILICEVLEEMGVKDKIVVATKAGNDFYNATKEDDAGYGTIRQNADYDYLISAAEKSLKRLNVDALDILQLHSPDTEKLRRDDPWRALEKLKKDGKIKHAGWSVQSFGENAQAFLLDEHHDLLDVIQVRYNLLEREAEKLLFPKAQQYGIGVIVRIPLLFGFLSGKFGRDTRFDPEDHRSMNLAPDKLEKYLQQLELMQPLYDKYPDQTKAQLALRFCITHPAAQVAIPGAKTEKQVLDNVAASDLGPLPLSDIPAL